MLSVLDLFSGIGGFTLAADRLGGFRTDTFVELNPYCQKILAKHWPDTPIHSDVRTFQPTQHYDVITAGFPCQDISHAGREAGIAGDRSGLFYEVIRLLRTIKPSYLILENVSNIVSQHQGDTLRTILGEIAGAGYDAEWAIVSARDVGACHLRKRWWCIAYPERTRLQGRWRQCGLRKGGAEVETGWSGGSSDWRDWRGYVSKPTICRGNDGLSNRVDRLMALGNAVVPACAAIPLQRVLDMERDAEHHA